MITLLLADNERKHNISQLDIILTVDEAKELRDKLEILLVDDSENAHEHVSSADYLTEITVQLERSISEADR